MFTLSRFGVPQEAAKKGFLNKEVAKTSEKGSSSYQGVPVFRKLRSVRTHPGSSSTFLEISAPPREFHKYRRGLRNLTKGSKVASEQKEAVSEGFETRCALSTNFTPTAGSSAAPNLSAHYGTLVWITFGEIWILTHGAGQTWFSVCFCLKEESRFAAPRVRTFVHRLWLRLCPAANLPLNNLSFATLC